MIYAVATSTWNDGALLAEWICWQRMLGFDRILVLSNDCEDPSPDLLEAFHRAGWIEHLAWAANRDRPALPQANRRILQHPAVAGADWLMRCDVDELTVVHAGGGRIRDLVPEDADFHAMAIPWRTFGAPLRHHLWYPEPQHRQMIRTGPPGGNPADRFFKSIYRDPARFRAIGSHAPKGFDGDWAGEGRRYVAADGTPLPYDPAGPEMMRMPPGSVVDHSVAQVNHYAVQAPEYYALKRGMPCASAFRDRYTDRFYKVHDQATVEDRSALRRADAFDAVWAEAMALPEIERHHLRCQRARIGRMVKHAGNLPREDRRWQGLTRRIRAL